MTGEEGTKTMPTGLPIINSLVASIVASVIGSKRSLSSWGPIGESMLTSHSLFIGGDCKATPLREEGSRTFATKSTEYSRRNVFLGTPKGSKMTVAMELGGEVGDIGDVL